ncbi:MAG: hypothetical protein ACMUIE_08375 [Thermoplasmatota archaeon]
MMMYCTKCGSDLKGSNVRCPVCGYEVVKMKMDLSQSPESRRQRPERKAWAPPIPDQRRGDVRTILEEDEEEKEEKGVKAWELDEKMEQRGRAEAGKKEEEEEYEDPRYVDGCAVCGTTPVDRCFFTLSPLCRRHTVYMQIFVRDMPFGDVIPAAPDIAQQKEGRNPTQMEAQEAGMFFAIKPYHEWRKVRK